MSLTRQRFAFMGSARYWDRHYVRSGTSGAGSYGALVDAKAEFFNNFVAKSRISSVIEFGCDDSHQLSLACILATLTLMSHGLP